MISKANSSCLTLTELNSFLAGNPDTLLKGRVEDHLLDCNLCFEAVTSLSLPEAGDYLYKIEELNADIKLKYNAGRKYQKSLYRYASAAAVLLVMLCSYIFYFNQSPSEKLFSEYFKPYPNVIPMVRGEGIDFELKAAMVLYNSGNYSGAITEFDKVLLYERNEIALFYKAVSLTAAGEYDQALPILQGIGSNSESKFRDQAQWYEALTLLAMERNESAARVLQKIKLSNNYFSERAGLVLMSLHKND